MYSGGIARYSIGTSGAIFTRKMALLAFGSTGQVLVDLYWEGIGGVLLEYWGSSGRCSVEVL